MTGEVNQIDNLGPNLLISSPNLSLRQVVLLSNLKGNIARFFLHPISQGTDFFFSFSEIELKFCVLERIKMSIILFNFI